MLGAYEGKAFKEKVPLALSGFDRSIKNLYELLTSASLAADSHSVSDRRLTDKLDREVENNQHLERKVRKLKRQVEEMSKDHEDEVRRLKRQIDDSKDHEDEVRRLKRQIEEMDRKISQ